MERASLISFVAPTSLPTAVTATSPGGSSLAQSMPRDAPPSGSPRAEYFPQVKYLPREATSVRRISAVCASSRAHRQCDSAAANEATCSAIRQILVAALIILDGAGLLLTLRVDTWVGRLLMLLLLTAPATATVVLLRGFPFPSFSVAALLVVRGYNRVQVEGVRQR
jgi:hypothetical protein